MTRLSSTERLNFGCSTRATSGRRPLECRCLPQQLRNHSIPEKIARLGNFPRACDCNTVASVSKQSSVKDIQKSIVTREQSKRGEFFYFACLAAQERSSESVAKKIDKFEFLILSRCGKLGG